MSKVRIFALIVLVTSSMAISNPVIAQGQDGTRAERNLQIIAEMLPGRFNNANQSYFDHRLNEPEQLRHRRLHTLVSRTQSSTSNGPVFNLELKPENEEQENEKYRFSLAVEKDGWSVRTRFYRYTKTGVNASADYLKGCDLFWREEAGQFRATTKDSSECRASGSWLPSELILSEDALWARFRNDMRRYYTLERSRKFSCYIDVPGVGGGRDIPYRRYEIEDIHDKGGQAWVTLDDGQEIYVRLQNIRWPMNNLKNIFTRHSFVIYIGKKENGEEKEISYAWTVPEAERVGVNLKWMLVNCFMINNENVKPFFKHEPRTSD